MAVIDRVTSDRLRSRVDRAGSGPLSLLLDLDLAMPGVDELVREVRSEVADEVWAWFREHRDDAVLTIRIALLIRYTVRVGELRPLIWMLVGSEPPAGEEP